MKGLTCVKESRLVFKKERLNEKGMNEMMNEISNVSKRRRFHRDEAHVISDAASIM